MYIFKCVTVGCGLEQKTVYFLMMPFTLRGGSQDTNTTEFDAAAAFTPAGGPGTKRNRWASWYISHIKHILLLRRSLWGFLHWL